MTEEIKYYKEKEYPLKWIPVEELEETPQQTIDRLKQENEELKKKIQILNKDSYTRLREMSVLDTELDEVGVINNNYRTALEEIRELILQECK